MLYNTILPFWELQMFKTIIDLVTMRGLLKVVGVIAILAVGFTSAKLMGPDNEVEQDAEQILKSQTGIDLDFSPEINGRGTFNKD